MNKTETTELLSLIKLAYPTAYRNMDDMTIRATVNMWQLTFPNVPYSIMLLAFDRFRMVSKFPPTVAELVDELRHIHFRAEECFLMHKHLGNEERMQQCQAIMGYTARYKDDTHLGGLNVGKLQELLSEGDE